LTTQRSIYLVTGDLAFLDAYGAGMLLEIARFWASIATYDHSSDRYELRGVMGPDEFHDGYPDRDTPGLDNNAYTNVMAAWVLCRALDTLELLPDHRRVELAERLGLRQEGIDRWDEASRKLRVCFHDGDIISQFEGYGEPRSWTGTACGAAMATSAGWTASWRPRATPPTATRRPSRPMC
jgi:alpha,alpha-trehalase